METDCPFMCTNNDVGGSLIRIQVNMMSMRNVDRKRNELKREWKKSVEINQGVKEERSEQIREIKERSSKEILTYILTYSLHGAESFLRS